MIPIREPSRGRGRGGGGRGRGGSSRGGGGGRGRGGAGGGRGGHELHNKHKDKRSENVGRAAKTNRAREAKQFSTISVPKRAEVKSSNFRPLAPELRAGGGGGGGGAPKTTSFESFDGKPSSSSSAVFDPIPNDGMFEVVRNSRYWPPPSLKDATVDGGAKDGMTLDQYDRAEDEKQRKKEVQRAIKDQRKKEPGELIHPRGKAPQNAKVSFDSDSD